jgi:hypothetical protein
MFRNIDQTNFPHRSDSSEYFDPAETRSNIMLNDDQKNYDKHSNLLNNLLGATTQNSQTLPNAKIEMEKDPFLVDSIRNSYIDDKLKSEREHKRKLRELKGKNSTNLTKKTEEAIEKIGNSIDDQNRINKLLLLNESLNYSTRPKQTFLANKEFNDTFDKNTDSSKLDFVKPKIHSRVIYSDVKSYVDHKTGSKELTDLESSEDIREAIYMEWYFKKMALEKRRTKDIDQSKRHEEEQKAEKLIKNLSKSQIAFKIWLDSKKEKSKKKENNTAQSSDSLEKKQDKLKDAELAFREWLKKKHELNAEKRKDTLMEKRKFKRDTRNLKETTRETKPPLPFEVWSTRKDEQIKQKNKLEKEKTQKAIDNEKELNLKARLAKKAFEEWLNKKEDSDLNKSNISQNAYQFTVPFYPASRKIISDY